MLRLANFELRGVDADGKAADTGIQIIAGDGALVALGKFPVRVEGERLGGDGLAFEKMRAKIHEGILEFSGAHFKMCRFAEGRAA
jgi:hypothetical protein